MKKVLFKDKRGYMRRALVRDTDPDSAANMGIPDGPPDISRLDWDTLRRDMSNALAENGAFDWDGLQRNQGGMIAALNVVKRALISLYREDDMNKKNKKVVGG